MSQNQWKYHVSEIGPHLFGASTTQRISDELAKRGALGWELVSVSFDSVTTRLFFKQPA